MSAFLRTLLVATALLSSGVSQVVLAMGDDACCAGEDAPAPACPPGVACACCPVRGAAPPAPVDPAPAATVTTPVPIGAIGPTVPAPPAEIFHPPRA